MDFRIFDEALALLLGKDPGVLTPAAMKKALSTAVTISRKRHKAMCMHRSII